MPSAVFRQECTLWNRHSVTSQRATGRCIYGQVYMRREKLSTPKRRLTGQVRDTDKQRYGADKQAHVSELPLLPISLSCAVPTLPLTKKLSQNPAPGRNTGHLTA